MRMPQLDGDQRRIRSGGQMDVLVHIAMILKKQKKNGGLPESRQVEASRSLTARRCMTNERQKQDQGKIMSDKKKVPPLST